MTYGPAVVDVLDGRVFKLTETHSAEIGPSVVPLLIPGERIVACFTADFDFVVFTDRRLVVVTAQGLTGKKRGFCSLPYRQVQAFSVEIAGTFDRDAELELRFGGEDRIGLRFKGAADVRALSLLIAQHVL